MWRRTGSRPTISAREKQLVSLVTTSVRRLATVSAPVPMKSAVQRAVTDVSRRLCGDRDGGHWRKARARSSCLAGLAMMGLLGRPYGPRLPLLRVGSLLERRPADHAADMPFPCPRGFVAIMRFSLISRFLLANPHDCTVPEELPPKSGVYSGISKDSRTLTTLERIVWMISRPGKRSRMLAHVGLHLRRWRHFLRPPLRKY